jgi:hypothetical protein
VQQLQQQLMVQQHPLLLDPQSSMILMELDYPQEQQQQRQLGSHQTSCLTVAGGGLPRSCACCRQA